MPEKNQVKIIGGGLAGTEAAIYLADRGVKVLLYDMKPKEFSPAHSSGNYAELVCSNSLKSNDVYGNAAGLLKEELRTLGSAVIAAADASRVPAGNALAVNREEFSSILTERVKTHPFIECVCERVDEIDFDNYSIIASGPLTAGGLSEKIKEISGGELYFYDASAPVVSFESIDMNHAFVADRYGKGDGDHINCPMDKEQYAAFIEALLGAKRAKLHEYENLSVFEGCMPVEVMAARGKDTLRFGPLKPAGLTDPETGRWPYACLQLRKEDKAGNMYNLIGFQTNLLFPEQKRVFGMIPALKNAEFMRYGVMHRNTFINSPRVLNRDYSLKKNGKTFFAGQITGVEGYVESAASGLMAAIACERKLNNKPCVELPSYSVMGALSLYITTPNENFQPMNANFGILPGTDAIIKDKNLRKKALAERSLDSIRRFRKEIEL